MTRPFYTPEALAQLDALEAYLIETVGAQVADAYLDRLLDFCDSLATDPIAGHLRDDLLPGLRTRIFERRRVVCFLTVGEETHIVALFGTGQQWETHLRDSTI